MNEERFFICRCNRRITRGIPMLPLKVFGKQTICLTFHRLQKQVYGPILSRLMEEISLLWLHCRGLSNLTYSGVYTNLDCPWSNHTVQRCCPRRGIYLATVTLRYPRPPSPPPAPLLPLPPAFPPSLPPHRIKQSVLLVFRNMPAERKDRALNRSLRVP